MLQIWKDCVRAAREAFGAGPVEAQLFVVGLMVWMGMMMLATWFIWIGIIGTILAIFHLLLMTEYTLRLYYRFRGSALTGNSNPLPTSPGTAVPVQWPTPCADAQGRLCSTDLQGMDVAAVAEQILRQATVRKVESRP